MHQNEILTMLHKVVAENQQYTTWTVSTPHLVALVNQAIEAEREACAALVEREWSTKLEKILCDELASYIRARGEA